MSRKKKPGGGTSDEWRPVEGFGGMYEVSDMGDVRSWRWRGCRRAEAPHLLTPFIRKRGSSGRGLYVKLTDENGAGHCVSVMGLVVEA